MHEQAWQQHTHPPQQATNQEEKRHDARASVGPPHFCKRHRQAFGPSYAAVHTPDHRLPRPRVTWSIESNRLKPTFVAQVGDSHHVKSKCADIADAIGPGGLRNWRHIGHRVVWPCEDSNAQGTLSSWGGNAGSNGKRVLHEPFHTSFRLPRASLSRQLGRIASFHLPPLPTVPSVTRSPPHPPPTHAQRSRLRACGRLKC